ncbi:MAG: putative lipid II flippase FtsW [Pseudomonadota bacterium]
MLQAKRISNRQEHAGIDDLLFGALAGLLVIGLIMVYSASIGMGDPNAVNSDVFVKQLTHVAIGCALMLTVSMIPVEFWHRTSTLILIMALLSLVAVLIVGVERNGSRRWLSFAGMVQQPAEFAKLAMVIYAASYLTRRQAEITQFSKGIVNIGIVLAVIAALLLLQPDFGSFFVITCTVGLMMFLGGIRILHTLFCIGLASVSMFFMVSMSGYRMQRLMSFRDPWADPFDSGFQLTQALIAVGRGEILGVGLGASIQKLYYLPHANNDFIFAVIAEELGLLGIMAVMALFALFLHRALAISRSAELVGRIYSARLAQGIGILIVFQALINMGVNLGALPTKGLTLPFISSGGSSMLVCCFAAGLLFAIDRQTKQRSVQTASTNKSSRRTKK